MATFFKLLSQHNFLSNKVYYKIHQQKPGPNKNHLTGIVISKRTKKNFARRVRLALIYLAIKYE